MEYIVYEFASSPFHIGYLKFPFQDKKKWQVMIGIRFWKKNIFTYALDLQRSTFQNVFNLNYTYIARERDRSSTR